mmetsp:Transcript_39925/g.103021  ORF Transcript_39925/g.103021 Transcript_39925/m.103021 type:complete len:205 (-) Transcript_39925:1528-2142(-)
MPPSILCWQRRETKKRMFLDLAVTTVHLFLRARVPVETRLRPCRSISQPAATSGRGSVFPFPTNSRTCFGGKNRVSRLFLHLRFLFSFWWGEGGRGSPFLVFPTQARAATQRKEGGRHKQRAESSWDRFCFHDTYCFRPCLSVCWCYLPFVRLRRDLVFFSSFLFEISEMALSVLSNKRNQKGKAAFLGYLKDLLEGKSSERGT